MESGVITIKLKLNLLIVILIIFIICYSNNIINIHYVKYFRINMQKYLYEIYDNYAIFALCRNCMYAEIAYNLGN